MVNLPSTWLMAWPAPITLMKLKHRGHSGFARLVRFCLIGPRPLLKSSPASGPTTPSITYEGALGAPEPRLPLLPCSAWHGKSQSLDWKEVPEMEEVLAFLLIVWLFVVMFVIAIGWAST